MYDSTGGSDEDRRDEAKRLLKIIEDGGIEDLSNKEQDFVNGLIDKLEKYGDGMKVSVRQLFWLRDIKDKQL